MEKIIKNSFVIIAGNFAENLIGLVLAASIARCFGESGFGKLSFLSVFLFLLSSLNSQLFRPILIREMSRQERFAPLLFGNCIMIQAAISLCAMLAFWVTVWFIRPDAGMLVLSAFATLTMLVFSISCVYEAVFQFKLKMGYVVFLNLSKKALMILLVLGLASRGKGLIDYYFYSVFIYLAALVALMFFADRLIKPVFKLEPALWRRIFGESWPLGLSTIFIFIYHRFDHIMLYKFNGDVSLGLYSAGTRISESLNVIPAAFAISMLPLLSKSFDSSKEEFKKRYRMLIKYFLIIIIPLAFYSTMFSKQIISLLYGERFISASPAFAVLMWGEIFVFAGVAVNVILIAAHEQRLDPFFTGISAAISVALNLLLIPRYGFLGAAFVSLVAYATGQVLAYFRKATKEYSKALAYFSIKPVLSGLIMFALIRYFKTEFFPSLIIAPILYLAALYFFKAVDKRDFHA